MHQASTGQEKLPEQSVAWRGRQKRSQQRQYLRKINYISLMKDKKEVWQRGPVESIPALLQPVAHALLQAREELLEIMHDFPETLLWERPAGVASPAFHIQHLSGVIDRLFTYAKGQSLNNEQLYALSIEGDREKCTLDLAGLLNQFSRQVDMALYELSNTNDSSLTEAREVGRQKIPTTLIGLYFHAAEHTMRHTGQLFVTVRVLKPPDPPKGGTSVQAVPINA